MNGQVSHEADERLGVARSRTSRRMLHATRAHGQVSHEAHERPGVARSRTTTEETRARSTPPDARSAHHHLVSCSAARPLATRSPRTPLRVAPALVGAASRPPPAPTPRRLTKHSRCSEKTTPAPTAPRRARPDRTSRTPWPGPPTHTPEPPLPPKTPRKTPVDKRRPRTRNKRTEDTATAPATPKHTRGKVYAGETNRQTRQRGKIPRSVRDT